MRPCEMGEAATRTAPWNEDQGGLSPDSYRQPLGDVKLTACTAQLKISSSTFYSKPWLYSMLSAPRVGGQAASSAPARLAVNSEQLFHLFEPQFLHQ